LDHVDALLGTTGTPPATRGARAARRSSVRWSSHGPLGGTRRSAAIRLPPCATSAWASV